MGDDSRFSGRSEAIEFAMEMAAKEVARVYVHRDMGPGFEHDVTNPKCPCEPMRMDAGMLDS